MFVGPTAIFNTIYNTIYISVSSCLIPANNHVYLNNELHTRTRQSMHFRYPTRQGLPRLKPQIAHVNGKGTFDSPHAKASLA